MGESNLDKIKINKITYHNFKGLRDFVFELNGYNANVYADNAVGKTTLYDGFLWLITGKDSQNKPTSPQNH
jgi:predicted ATPase